MSTWARPSGFASSTAHFTSPLSDPLSLSRVCVRVAGGLLLARQVERERDARRIEERRNLIAPTFDEGRNPHSESEVSFRVELEVVSAHGFDDAEWLYIQHEVAP